MRIDKAPCGNLPVEGWSLDKVFVSDSDREILVDLAKRLKAQAELPEQQGKAQLWKDSNSLKSTRPVILIDPENGWNEVFPWDKTIKCQGEMAGDWEMWLRKELYYAEVIKDDKPITAEFYVPYTATDSKWGIAEIRHGDPQAGEAYTWEAPLAKLEEEEFENANLADYIKTPIITVDYEASNASLALAKEIFDGILTVSRRHRWFWSEELSLSYSNIRGLENMMCDFYDYPEKVHEMMRLFTDGYIAKIKFLEANGLLNDNTLNHYTGSGGMGCTDELNSADPDNVKLMDIWGFHESQETSEVSPQMVGEFVIPYQIEIAERFGLNYYGCCEGVDGRWESVKQIPRLRRVSVSQWANYEKMSEQLGSDYVFVHKVSPTDIAVPEPDVEYMKDRLRHLLTVCKKNNNHVELIMKDNHTIANKPENLKLWVDIAREIISEIYG